MLLKLLILLSMLCFAGRGQSGLYWAPDEPDTIFLSLKKYIVLYVVKDTVEVRYDTLFKTAPLGYGLYIDSVVNIDTSYLHSDFDLKKFREWDSKKISHPKKRWRIFLK